MKNTNNEKTPTGVFSRAYSLDSIQKSCYNTVTIKIFFGAGCNSPPAVKSAKKGVKPFPIRCNSVTDGIVRIGKRMRK